MATFVYLKDAANVTWQVGVNDSGELVTQPAGAQATPAINLSDYLGGGTSWALGIDTFGRLTTTSIGFLASYGLSFNLFSASGLVYAVLVTTAGELAVLQTTPFGNFAYPKIVYPAGVGNVFLPKFVPRYVPAYIYESVRFDNVADSGVRESLWLRTDAFFEATIEWVAFPFDLGGWNQFMLYALQGGAFDYYPDKNAAGFTTYVLEDKTWNAAYKSGGQYTFKTRWRKRVAWPG